VLVRSPGYHRVAVVFEQFQDFVHRAEDRGMRKYISVRSIVPNRQTTRSELGLNHFFFAGPPRHWDDFRIILPRLFGEDRSQKESKVGRGVRQRSHHAVHRLLTLHAVCHLGVW